MLWRRKMAATSTNMTNRCFCHVVFLSTARRSIPFFFGQDIFSTYWTQWRCLTAAENKSNGKITDDSIYTEVELRQDCLSFSIFLSSKFFCVKVSHCFLLCLRSLLQWTDVLLFLLFVCSLSIVLFCSFPIKLVLFRMLETANDLPFSSSPSLKSTNFAISLPLTSMCCFQSMCYGLPSEHKQQQRTGLWWKVVSFPPSPDELSISSPNAKCQKLCGGQRFELQSCLHHRGEQTRDGHAIPCPKPTFLIRLLNLSLTEKG